MAAGSAPDPLAAVAVLSPAVRAEPRAGGAVLSVAEPPGGPVAAFVATRLGWARRRSFELDAVGARFVAEIDGQRSLGEIKDILRREFGWGDAEARQAVVGFTAALMRRGLLALQVTRSGGAP